jgi:DNA-directed RNA polymerase subunit alpha
MEILETRIESGHDGLFHYGKFYCTQVKKGQGITLANSLRRVLLYDVSGFGITHARIFTSNQNETKTNEQFAIHEFSSIPGLRESVFELLLNLRSIVFRGESAVSRTQIFQFSSKHLKVDTSTESDSLNGFIFRAKHLQKTFGNSSLVLPEIVNPEQYLGTIMLSHCPDFEIEYILNPTLAKSGIWLPTEGNFFPVKRVNYSIEENSDFTESVFIEIWTNGAIDPSTALSRGFDVLFQLFQDAAGKNRVLSY